MTTFDYNNHLMTQYLENDTPWGDEPDETQTNDITYAERVLLAQQHKYNLQQYVRDAPIQTISVSTGTDEEGKVVHFNKYKWYNTKMGTDDHKMFISSGWAGSRLWFENVDHMRKYYLHVHNTDLTLDPDYLIELDKKTKVYRAYIEKNEPHKMKVRNVL
jgi:hypothetical protein